MKRALPSVLFLLSMSACAHPRAAVMAPSLAGSCRTASARWYAPDDPHSRARLDSWCAGVGPLTVSNGMAAPAERVTLQEITFVSWNVHVGNGDVTAFVRDLRAGRWTNGRPPGHVVLLLQEAVRAVGVPDLSPNAEGASRISAAHQDAEDIEVISRELGLWLVYAPSMRNGNDVDDPSTDRGSAILSTLPLSSPTAIELPFERQRRVALLADVALSQADSLSVGAIHLDALNGARRLWLFGTRTWRAMQAKALAPLLPRGNLVLGADLNTWLGAGEPASLYLQQLFADTRAAAGESKSHRRQLDYIFLRGAPPATAHSLVVPNKYGSDHHPLIGWFDSAAKAAPYR